MAKKTGQMAKLEIDVDGTAVEVGELREWSVSVSSSKVDSTVAGQDWESHLIGHKSWEGEGTVVDIDILWLDYINDKATINFYHDAADTEPRYTGNASLDIEETTPYDDLIESSLTFTGDGPLEHGQESGTTT